MLYQGVKLCKDATNSVASSTVQLPSTTVCMGEGYVEVCDFELYFFLLCKATFQCMKSATQIR